MTMHRNYLSQQSLFAQKLSSERLDREQQIENDREEVLRDLPFTD